MAAPSRHPHSLALAAASPAPAEPFDSVSEQPGLGLEAVRGETVFRLGRADWALEGGDPAGRDELGTVLSRNGVFVADFRFDDREIGRASFRERVFQYG